MRMTRLPETARWCRRSYAPQMTKPSRVRAGTSTQSADWPSITIGFTPSSLYLAPAGVAVVATLADAHANRFLVIFDAVDHDATWWAVQSVLPW